MKKIKIIVAKGKQNQIGLNGRMPWHLHDDLQNFKKLTTGQVIIMGRKTFESIGKALPNRLNFVVTSNTENVNAYGVCLFENLEKAIKKARETDKEIFIIGGGKIYEQSIELADELIITEVDYNGKADTFFPKIDMKIWKEKNRKHFTKDTKNDFDFDVICYERQILNKTK